MFAFRSFPASLFAIGCVTILNAQTVTEQQLKVVGSASLAAGGAFGAPSPSEKGQAFAMRKPDLVAARKAGINGIVGSNSQTLDDAISAAATAALTNPAPAPKNVIGTRPNFSGFAGLTALDNLTVNGFDLEPPDQGLAVGADLFSRQSTSCWPFTTRLEISLVDLFPSTRFSGLRRAMTVRPDNTGQR